MYRFYPKEAPKWCGAFLLLARAFGARPKKESAANDKGAYGAGSVDGARLLLERSEFVLDEKSFLFLKCRGPFGPPGPGFFRARFCQ